MIKLKSRSLQFCKDDHPRSAAQAKPTVNKVQGKNVWPHLPVDLRKTRWVLGDTTEVLDHDSWRLGKIADVLNNDYFVIRLMGCIQLREFHISCLRAPRSYHSKQLTVTDSDSELSKPIQLAGRSFDHSKFVIEQDHQAYEEDDHNTKRKAANLCASTSARIVERKLEASRIVPHHLLRRTSKKRKAAAYEVRQPTKKVLPLKVSARNGIDGGRFYRPLSGRCNDPAKNNIAKTKPDCIISRSPEIPLHVREEDECSVASCSANYLEYCANDDQKSVAIGSCFPDDVISACPSISGDKNDAYGSDLDISVHELELQAYQSTVRAFYASGSLTWEQESLLTNLRLSLNISNEEHLLQLRHLLSS